MILTSPGRSNPRHAPTSGPSPSVTACAQVRPRAHHREPAVTLLRRRLGLGWGDHHGFRLHRRSRFGLRRLPGLRFPRPASGATSTWLPGLGTPGARRRSAPAQAGGTPRRQWPVARAPACARASFSAPHRLELQRFPLPDRPVRAKHRRQGQLRLHHPLQNRPTDHGTATRTSRSSSSAGLNSDVPCAASSNRGDRARSDTRTRPRSPHSSRTTPALPPERRGRQQENPDLPAAGEAGAAGGSMHLPSPAHRQRPGPSRPPAAPDRRQRIGAASFHRCPGPDSTDFDLSRPNRVSDP